MAVTDIILLLIMLVGLFRLRRNRCGTFGLAQLLWKQVRCLFSLTVLTELRFMNCFHLGSHLVLTGHRG